jgi:RNA 2',3'-cyclic 3'-phosphodiesterase
MRLFVAIALPGSVASELDEVVAPLRSGWPGLRWTGRDAWHLTLAFLGEVDEALLQDLRARLERGARRHPRLTLSLAGAGAFPTAIRARVLWTGVHAEGLAQLAATVSAGARRAGVGLTTRERRYQPHLTLARCRAPLDVTPLVERLAGFQGAPWQAREIYLIHSHLGTQPGEQPRYETIGSWSLREPRPPRQARQQRGPASAGPLPGLDGGSAAGLVPLPCEQAGWAAEDTPG